MENIALPIAGGAGAAALAVWGADKMDFHPDGVATAAALGGAAVAYMADNQTVKKVAIGAAALGTGLKVLGWMRSRQQPQQQPKPGQQPQQQAQQPRRQAEGDEYVTRRQLDEVVRAALAANNQEIVGVFRAELRNLNQPSALPSSGPTSSASSPAQRRDPWAMRNAPDDDMRNADGDDYRNAAVGQSAPNADDYRNAGGDDEYRNADDDYRNADGDDYRNADGDDYRNADGDEYRNADDDYRNADGDDNRNADGDDFRNAREED